MELIILDINRKNELISKREVKEALNYANLISIGNNIEIIEPVEEYDQILRKMYANDYAIYKKVSCKEININKLSRYINLNKDDMIMLPYFNSTRFWLKVKIEDKESFLTHMYEHGFFNSFSIICLNEKIIYDIELNEQEYEIRICNY